MRASQSRMWLWWLAVGLVAAVATSLSKGAPGEVAYLCFGVLSMALLFTGIRRNQPSSKVPWLYFAVGNACLFLGDIAASVIETESRTGTDVLYLLGYALLIVGGLRIWRSHGLRLVRSNVLDTVILGIQAFVVLWVFVLDRPVAGTASAQATGLIASAYILCALSVGVLAGGIVLFVRQRTISHWLLVAGFITLVPTGIALQFSSSAVQYLPDVLVEATWLVSYLLFGIAALHPSMRSVTEVGLQDPVSFTWKRLVFYGMAGLTVPISFTAEYAMTGHVDWPLVFSSAIALWLTVVYRLYVALAEVTRVARDRDRVTANLQTSEARWSSIVKHSTDMIVLIDEQADVMWVSPAVQNHLGFTPEEFEGINSFSLVHPDDVELASDVLAEVVSSSETRSLEVRLQHKDGRWRWFWAQGMNLLEDPNVGAIVASARDITERKEAAEALRTSEEKIREQEEFERAILDSLSAHVAVVDARGWILAVNHAWVNLSHTLTLQEGRSMTLGGSLLETLRRSLELRPSFELAMALEGLEAILAGRREHFSIEFGIDSPDGERAFAMHVSPLRGSAGGAVVSLLDVTERTLALREQERLTEQLRQSQKLEAIGRLAGGIAHDFNNVLAVIQNYAWFLAEDMDPNDPKRQDVKEIYSAGERAGKLVQQLLTFSRKEIVKPEILDVNEVIEDYGKFLRSAIGEDVRLEMKLASRVPPILLDSGHVGQILTNLAVNARDAMPDGGCLVIETSSVALTPEDAVDELPIGDYVVLAVKDDGSGMPDEVLPHIFEPFFTTKARGQGTGLGLATIYGIVNQAGGHIKVETSSGEGTTFSIYLPAIRALEKRDEEECKSPDEKRGRETVLVAEDEESVRRMVERLLSTHGYTVVTAQSGEDAIHKATEYQGHIDLLLTDVVMPQMSGKALAEAMSTIRPTTKTIFMSGYTDEVIARSGKLGAGEILIEKPFTAEQLLLAIREVLEERATV